MAIAFDSFQAKAFTAIKVHISDGSMEPDFPFGWIALIGPAPATIPPGVAVYVELFDGVRVVRWFIKSLGYGSFLLAANPFLGLPKLQVTPRNSRVIGLVFDVESVNCEAEMTRRKACSIAS
jgi:Peptidase S24-like